MLKTVFAGKKAKVILIAVLSVILLGAVAAIILITGNQPTEELANGAVVYEDGGAVFAFINGKKVKIENNTADRFAYDETGGRLFYTVASAYSQGTFDLYTLNAEDAEPSLLDYGITGVYYVGKNGESLYYIKQSGEGNNPEGICYDLAGRQMITFAQNPEALYVPASAEEMYFTRLHGSNRVLYAYQPGGTPQELFRNAEEIRLFDGDTPELFFESTAGSNNVSLQIVYQGEKPLLVSDGVTEVLWDGYKAGGNLYYCTACNNGVSWRAVIGDTFAESDAVLTEPNRGDYFSVFGYYIGYSTAKAVYERKVRRDEVRSALDEAFAGQEGFCDAYAYNKTGSVLLAESIRGADIKAAANAGEPKLLYGSITASESDLDITDLTDISTESGIEAAVAQAAETVESKTENNGLQMAVIYQGAVSYYGLDGFPQQAGFCFSQDGSSVFALAKSGESETLYVGSFSEEQKPENGQQIADAVTDTCFTRNGVVYMKVTCTDGAGTVYRREGIETETLSENSYAFLIKGGVFTLKNYVSSANGENATADYYYCSGGREVPVGKAVRVNTVTAGASGRIAFLCESGLVLCSGEDTYTVSNQATHILYIH